MQLVAASKMRRAQEVTKASMPYTLAAREILTALSRHTAAKEHPLFVKRPVKSRLVIVIASDKGLAGSYNSNVLKLYAQQLMDDRQNSITSKTVTIGRKAAQFAARIKDIDVLGSYEGIPDQPTNNELRAILDTARQQFIGGMVDAVDVIYTEFVSGITQEARLLRVLPAGFEPVDDVRPSDALYEPDPSVVLNAVAYRLIEAQIFQSLLDARASEHSMRMVAMKNATDNAADLIDDLTLAMNKARQGAITQELAEISGGVEALNV